MKHDELQAAYQALQALCTQAADALQEHVNSLIETHKEPNGVVYGEVAEILRSKCDLIDRLRAAALPVMRQQPEQTDEPDGLHLAAVELARQQHTVIQDLQETLAATNRQVKSLTEALAQPASAIPHGYKLVPVEPTKEMLDAVVTSMDEALHGPNAERQYIEDWKAMLAAAPQQKGS